MGFFHVKKIKVPSQNMCPPLKQAKQRKTRKCHDVMAVITFAFLVFLSMVMGNCCCFLTVGAMVVSSGKRN